MCSITLLIHHRELFNRKQIFKEKGRQETVNAHQRVPKKKGTAGQID